MRHVSRFGTFQCAMVAFSFDDSLYYFVYYSCSRAVVAQLLGTSVVRKRVRQFESVSAAQLFNLITILRRISWPKQKYENQAISTSISTLLRQKTTLNNNHKRLLQQILWTPGEL